LDSEIIVQYSYINSLSQITTIGALNRNNQFENCEKATKYLLSMLVRLFRFILSIRRIIPEITV